MTYLLIIILVGLFISYLIVKYVLLDNKQDVYADLKQYFNARSHFNGGLELELANRKILVEYDTEISPGKVYEYILAYVDFSDIPREKLEKCRLNIDYTEKNGKTYAVIYSSWGYHGEKFRQRITEKISELEECFRK